jgi:hypothetical protein
MQDGLQHGNGAIGIGPGVGRAGDFSGKSAHSGHPLKYEAGDHDRATLQGRT